MIVQNSNILRCPELPPTVSILKVLLHLHWNLRIKNKVFLSLEVENVLVLWENAHLGP